jgi:hypothetical protein
MSCSKRPTADWPMSVGAFSAPAFHLVKLKISDYVRSLIIESSKISRRRRADVISAAHVEEASDYLVTSSSRRWFRHIGTVGGILLGASLSNFLSMTTGNQYSATGVIVPRSLQSSELLGLHFTLGRNNPASLRQRFEKTSPCSYASSRGESLECQDSQGFQDRTGSSSRASTAMNRRTCMSSARKRPVSSGSIRSDLPATTASAPGS